MAKGVEAGVKTVEAVAPDAVEAAKGIDAALKTGAAASETAMKDLVVSPAAEVKNAGQVVGIKEVAASDATIEAQWADQKHTEILRSVQPQITEWEKANPPGDDIPGWIERRAAAEKQFTVNEAVNRDLEEWKSKEENHPPDKSQDPDGYARWEQRLAAQESERRKANEASYEQFLAQQEEKNQGMSNQEFMRLYAVLLQKRAAADKFAMYLAKQPREQYVRLLPVLEDMRNKIGLLEAQLSFDAAGNKWKEWIIPAAVGVSMAAGAMAGPANEV